MPYDAGLLQRCLDTLESAGIRNVRSKNVFGMRGLMFGEKMFAAVGENGMIVKLRPEEFESALAQTGVSKFTPGGAPLGKWVEIEGDVVADDPDLRDWLDAGLRALR